MNAMSKKRKLSLISTNVPLVRINTPSTIIGFNINIIKDGQENDRKKLRLDYDESSKWQSKTNLAHTISKNACVLVSSSPLENQVKPKQASSTIDIVGQETNQDCTLIDNKSIEKEKEPIINTSSERSIVILSSDSSSSSSSSSSDCQSSSSAQSIPISHNENVTPGPVAAELEDRGHMNPSVAQFLSPRSKRPDTSLWFCTEYMEDIIAHELQKESHHKFSHNYCRKFQITPVRREILVDWLISVQVYTKAFNRTLHLAVDLMDILFDTVDIPLSNLQMSAAAAFWVAYKFIDGDMNVKEIIRFLHKSVTKKMVREEERQVIRSSKGIQTNGDTLIFVNYYLYKMYGPNFPGEIYYCCQYLAEIMLYVNYYLNFTPAERAAGAVYTTHVLFNSTRFSLIVNLPLIESVNLELINKDLIKHLKRINSENGKQRGYHIFMKYKSSRYYRISMHSNVHCIR